MRRRGVVTVGAVLVLAAGCGVSEPVAGTAGEAAAPQAAAPTERVGRGMASEHMPMDAAASEHGGVGHVDRGEGAHAFAFGARADASKADRVVNVETVEEGGFHYEPSTIEVQAGETVTFRVHNVGEAVHEFVLGDEDLQAEHEAEMRAMASDAPMMMHDEANAISIPPGETRELTWAFTESTGIIYGCHEPGHYAAGMRGDLTVVE